MTVIVSGLDIETTGIEQSAGHRIIEFAIVHYNFVTGKKVGQYVQRIDPKRPIDPKAQEVHGIAITDLVGEPVWENVASAITMELQKSNFIVAHNAGFDMPFVGAELLRVGERIPAVNSYCTMENGRWATFDGKSPKLQELCMALGVEYDPAYAHAALYDVEKTMECYFRGVSRTFFNAPLTK